MLVVCMRAEVGDYSFINGKDLDSLSLSIERENFKIQRERVSTGRGGRNGTHSSGKHHPR